MSREIKTWQSWNLVLLLCCLFNIWTLFAYFKNHQVAFWLWFGPCCKNWLAFPSVCFRLTEIFKTYFKIVCLSFDINVLYFELWGLQTHLWSICFKIDSISDPWRPWTEYLAVEINSKKCVPMSLWVDFWKYLGTLKLTKKSFCGRDLGT